MQYKQLIFTIFVAIFALVISGCYTQLGTVKNESPEYTEEYSGEEYTQDSQNDNEYQYDDRAAVINNYYYDGAYWYPRHRWMFSSYYPSYYWPSVAFSYAYYDPWFYDRYWYYDPWVCGTPWVYYGHYNHYNYYNPYYYYWGSGYYGGGKTITRTNRDFGDTRGGRADIDQPRDGRPAGHGRSDLPSGVGVVGSSGRSQSDSPVNVRKPSRNDGSTRGVSPRTGERPSARKGDATRSGSRRDRYDGESRGTRPSQPSGNESGRTIERGGSNDRGGSRSEDTRPSYVPPPPPASSSPAPAAPPSQSPSRGGDSRSGSNDNNSSSRGGSTRGGR